MSTNKKEPHFIQEKERNTNILYFSQQCVCGNFFMFVFEVVEQSKLFWSITFDHFVV